MKNYKEKIMIACLDVLSVVDEDEMTKQKRFSDKCIALGNEILKLLKKHSVLKESDKFGNLLFAQSFWDNLLGKIRLSMAENYKPEESYYKLEA